ncbi:F-box/RNI superfamily protein, putative [Medicago truncatula]|uniref:F-box/RNI superfamily protein, putative n=1 Tax=Medicago truncatula TaxID=3880 RepID=A0A072TZ91_MEDTR|nr:F-box/RNI superfamily protein, putative [Medicago truncatula]
MSSHHSIPNVDRISALPDSIICHILSFLPTQQSAATTILSKRWKPLWHSLLTLHFDDRNFTDFATFRHFVYSVMLTRQTIRSFHLKCGLSSRCDPHDINRFVPVAVEKGIESISLDFSFTDFHFQIRLDTTFSSVFNCKNLVVLKLKKLLLNVVPQFHFPRLKTLHFDSVYPMGDDNEGFNTLVERCPVLQELETIDVRFRVPTDCVGGEFKFHTLHNLTHMELVFASNWQTKWKWLVEVLEHCPKLQNLTLDQLYGYGTGEDNWKKPKIVPECIYSQLRTCSLTSYKGNELQFANDLVFNLRAEQTGSVELVWVSEFHASDGIVDMSHCTRCYRDDEHTVGELQTRNFV